MRIERSVCALLLAAAAAAAAQSLPLDEIRARGATALTREEVVELVSGARVTWISVKGERKWTNRPDGSLTVTRIGGPGGFNPHHKSGRGKWVVRDGVGHMLTDGWCWRFFRLDGQLLMNLTPENDEVTGGTITIDR